MHCLSTFLALLAASTVTALPLNINLGAYSPALVVGDGEISFGGGEEASALLETLSGASQESAAAAGEAVTGTENQVAEGTPSIITPIISAIPSASASASATPELLSGLGIGRDIEPRVADDVEIVKAKRDINVDMEGRDLAGFNAALDFAAGALKTSPGVQLGTGAEGSGVGIIVQPGVDAGGAATEAVIVGRDFETREAEVVGQRGI
jgi:hypothetical protein